MLERTLAVARNRSQQPRRLPFLHCHMAHFFTPSRAHELKPNREQTIVFVTLQCATQGSIIRMAGKA